MDGNDGENERNEDDGNNESNGCGVGISIF
jgi:hypothetical protein